MAYRAFIVLLGAALLASHDSLRKIAVIDVPGPKGQRFDYLTIDAEDHYLLSGHLGPGILYVVDMHTNKLAKTISGAARHHRARVRPRTAQGVHLELG
jgi:hypothetical protein